MVRSPSFGGQNTYIETANRKQTMSKKKPLATIATLKDGDTLIIVEWLGGDDHRVTFSDEGREFKYVDCSSLAYAFAAVYEFSAYEHLICDENYRVDVRVA